jgi:hypothetical protein
MKYYLTAHFRQGRSVDTDMLQRILRMLSALNIYAQNFEAPFLQDSKRFFTAEGMHLMDVCDITQFFVSR